ncbi:MAG: 16S rRNA (cytosine(1402)-N(4))-methyltransferase [Candidatus Levybacteria bacterium CG_4_9_14_3_um_filter_35_16]|nr:MAG: 16S rRNA (cytosine(1402)-N(4))-methyltransferase [Candidatus Levybacteria bacterium CG22_combo_CG10-13_8_21_14_all_35_11]PIY94862.1 MAG: 16S rRNA (cytosine(1402)-N(4))-methyltransferase [Candidatus Levybacteria bacterium CG_4_10_14_0_8_um_filter_35_23]PJA91267.1 MAG: 16S rRNA (cytosine(1402)-N(4))-methyltransferase [Candidatus Levybacteria bacterium CG_4_9_14_3_um_filter_35_16]PJC54290.1 MAG: 16S rRNA (cytosine(1402)-N(4))-methyltransferase [Candidatus Levybacteria bacterium CG_4_9_14_0_
MNDYHVSVLLKEAIELLQVKKNGKYIDATLGGGGHTRAVLENGGLVLGIDLDQEALYFINQNQISNIKNQKLILTQGNFKDIARIARLNRFEKVDGIIYDVGVSSHQIDSGERGFSYLKNGPLDMRMDKENAVKASDLINILTKGDLYELFSRLGQERRARVISDRIVRARGIKAIQTTEELLEVIKDAYGLKTKTLSPFIKAAISKRVFQALRMAVNSELENLKESLPQAIDLLEKGGRIVTITFHSLEDRIVKHSFLEFEKNKQGKIITKKPMIPNEEEIRNNRRSASAKLRVFEKLI